MENNTKVHPIQEKLWDKTVPNWQKRASIEKVVTLMNKYKDDRYLSTIISNALVFLSTKQYIKIIVREAKKYLDVPPNQLFQKLREIYPYPQWDL